MKDSKVERVKGNDAALSIDVPLPLPRSKSMNKGDAPTSTALVKAELSKGPIWLETMEGELEEVEREVALLSPLIQRQVLRYGHGVSQDLPVALPKQVGLGVLKLLLEYCRFHRVPGRSDKERKIFDEKFIRLDTRRLCELTSAADSLDMKPLVDLTSRALARMIEGKTPEEIRETFHLPDDLTEEEKLEPVKNATDDPRIRLLNRLYARKRKELHEKKLLKGLAVNDTNSHDERSVDDLLEFIDGGATENKAAKGSKSRKKKKGKKKESAEEARDGLMASPQPRSSGDKGGDCFPQSAWLRIDSSPRQHSSRVKQSEAAAPRRPAAHPQAASTNGFHKELFEEVEFDDDDGLDPAEKERLDREVEDFARRLNSDWHDRKEEILALASSSSSQDLLQPQLERSRSSSSSSREPLEPPSPMSELPDVSTSSMRHLLPSSLWKARAVPDEPAGELQANAAEAMVEEIAAAGTENPARLPGGREQSRVEFLVSRAREGLDRRPETSGQYELLIPAQAAESEGPLPLSQGSSGRSKRKDFMTNADEALGSGGGGESALDLPPVVRRGPGQWEEEGTVLDSSELGSTLAQMTLVATPVEGCRATGPASESVDAPGFAAAQEVAGWSEKVEVSPPMVDSRREGGDMNFANGVKPSVNIITTSQGLLKLEDILPSQLYPDDEVSPSKAQGLDWKLDPRRPLVDADELAGLLQSFVRLLHLEPLVEVSVRPPSDTGSNGKQTLPIAPHLPLYPHIVNEKLEFRHRFIGSGAEISLILPNNSLMNETN